MIKPFLPIVLLAAATVSHANETHRAANREVSLSIGAQQLDYIEIDDVGVTSDGVLDAERGGQPAAQFALGFQGDLAGLDDLYARIEVASAQGKTQYQGYLQGGPELIPYTDSTRNRISDASARLGKVWSYPGDEAWAFTPYIQLGARSWVRASPKPFGYREDYSHQSAGLGLLTQWAGERAVLSFDIGYAKMFNPRLNVNEFDVKLSLGRRDILTAGVGVDFSLGEFSHLLLNYQFTEFEYGISPQAYSPILDADLLEPNSKTKQHRLFVGFAFGY